MAEYKTQKVIRNYTVSCKSLFKLISSDQQFVRIFANHVLNCLVFL